MSEVEWLQKRYNIYRRYLTIILAPRGSGKFYPVTAKDSDNKERKQLKKTVKEKMKKKTQTVPEFKSIEEEANFWDTHSSEDFPDYWEPAPEVKFSKNLKSIYQKVIPIRLDEQTKKAIEKVAREKGIGISTTARMLIRERLLELKAI